MRVKGWNPAFDGLRVALISDIHAGIERHRRKKMHKIVAMTNEQAVDVIFLLGDYVSQDRPNEATQRRELRTQPAAIADG